MPASERGGLSPQSVLGGTRRSARRLLACPLSGGEFGPAEVRCGSEAEVSTLTDADEVLDMLGQKAVQFAAP